MGTFSINISRVTWFLIAVVAAWLLWNFLNWAKARAKVAYHRTKNRYQRRRRKRNAVWIGEPDESSGSSRRSVLYLVGALGAGGIGTFVVIKTGDSVPAAASKITDGVEDRLNDIPQLQPGTRKFNFYGNGGYRSAEWNANGSLLITFADNPPMEEWYLVGPEPDRAVLESGSPPEFGGSETISLDFPIETGEYMLTGVKTVLDANSIFGADLQRTGTARFDITAELELKSITPLEDDYGRAELELYNVGSCPFYANGVKFVDGDVPGNGTRDYFWFEGTQQLVLPTETVSVTTTSYPFYDPVKEEVVVPDKYRLSIWAHDEPHDFQVSGRAISPREP